MDQSHPLKSNLKNMDRELTLFQVISLFPHVCTKYFLRVADVEEVVALGEVEILTDQHALAEVVAAEAVVQLIASSKRL